MKIEECDKKQFHMKSNKIRGRILWFNKEYNEQLKRGSKEWDNYEKGKLQFKEVKRKPLHDPKNKEVI